MSDPRQAIAAALRNVAQAVRDRIAILRLRWQIAAEKVRNYDRLVADLQGLMQALRTKDRQIADLNRKLDREKKRFEALQNEVARLQESGRADQTDIVNAERQALFNKLESVLIQLPSIKKAVESGADVDGQQVLDVVAPLEDAMRTLGFETIGEAGAELAFEPRLHKAVGKGARSVQDADQVRVRYVGYQYQGDILAKAEVTVVGVKEKVT